MIQTICFRRPDSHKRWFFLFFWESFLVASKETLVCFIYKKRICIFSERLILENREWMSVMLRCNAWRVSAWTWRERSGNVNFRENSVIRGGLRVLIATKHVRFCSQFVVFGWILVFFFPFFFFSCVFGAAFKASSRHPLQDVEDADAVDGDEGGEVGRDVDPLQRGSRRVEGLQRLAFLHVPPLDDKQREKDGEIVETLWAENAVAQIKRRGRRFRSQASRFHWFPLVMLSYDTDIVWDVSEGCCVPCS